MPSHVLLSQRWDRSTTELPGVIASWQPSSTNATAMSPLRTSPAARVLLHASIARAIVSYVNGSAANVALIEVGSASYAAEMPTAGMSTVLVAANKPTPSSNTVRLRAAEVTATGAYQPLPAISRNSQINLEPIFLSLIPFCMNHIQTDMDLLQISYAANGNFDSVENEFRSVSDTIEVCLENRLLDVNVPSGNIDVLTKDVVTMGALAGNVVCGNPVILMGSSRAASACQAMTLAEAKSEFYEFAKSHSWSDEERSLIPVFPDDYPVPPEAIKIARRFVGTRENKRPMKNFMWRGVTSYGKSTGVELMAAFLNMPLLRMTCNSNTETQNFLSDFVPDNGPGNTCGELPAFEEIVCDPASAYFKLTGKQDDDATGEMCLKAYGEAVAANAGTTAARFKHIESNFVRALSRGYIVEIQEISRIRDPGVLVGLNEFDRPGAIIPLVDGSFTRRHPDAMAVYTDNVGYASCRAIDPSVIRRMSFVLDSYEITRDMVIQRVLYNVGFKDKALLEKMYEVWKKVQEYCEEKDITEGSVSASELEMWCQAVQADGMTNIKENCRDCVVAKATSNRDEQNAIMADVIALYI